MLRKLGVKAAAFGLVVTAGALCLSAPAGAIQTPTWGVQPAAHDGHARSSFSYPSNGQTVHDTLEVYNVSAQPVDIKLSVLGATKDGTSYQFSLKRTGVAAGVSLAGYDVTVPPHEQANIPVTIRLPRHSNVTTLAAIAAEGASVKRGSLLIQERLVILVKATPSTHPALVPDLALWGPIAGGVLAGACVLLGREARNRRRPVPGGASPVDVPAPEMAGAR